MNELETNEIGARIKKIRGQLTQKEFADLLGVGRTSVVRYESGERTPDAEFLVKLNVIYKVQPLWLLTGQGADIAGEKLTPAESILLNNYRHCLPEGKAALMTTSAAFVAGSVAPSKKTKQIEGSIQNFHGRVDQVAGRDVVNQGGRKK